MLLKSLISIKTLLNLNDALLIWDLTYSLQSKVHIYHLFCIACFKILGAVEKVLFGMVVAFHDFDLLRVTILTNSITTWQIVMLLHALMNQVTHGHRKLCKWILIPPLFNILHHFFITKSGERFIYINSMIWRIMLHSYLNGKWRSFKYFFFLIRFWLIMFCFLIYLIW